MDLNKDVKFIKGVGPNRVKLLNKIGIYTLKDLITYVFELDILLKE